jgi:hypothetical protein
MGKNDPGVIRTAPSVIVRSCARTINRHAQRLPGLTRQRVDVRSLSLAQLQKLAAHGSQRARAELESRMNAPSGAPAPPAPKAAAATAVAAEASAAPGPGSPRVPLTEQFELIARQDAERTRADGPPRLVGMVLIGWSMLLLFGALFMLSRGGLYYLFCALAMAAVGWLLMQRSRWAMALHGVLLLAALVWAWLRARGSLGLALFEAVPLLISAAWMAVPSVREPLE